MAVILVEVAVEMAVSNMKSNKALGEYGGSVDGGDAITIATCLYALQKLFWFLVLILSRGATR